VNIRRGTRLGDQPVQFTFDGRAYTGQAGDTAASALLANGVWGMGRSVKYRRLRGVFGASAEEPNALLTLGSAPAIIPNLPATTLLLHEGMRLASQNRWPSLRWNASSVLRLGKGLLGAGFYYKTFLWPSWHAYEGMIRRLAGLGPAPGRSELPLPRVEHCACDVLVVGGGAAGLIAARTLQRAGLDVMLCEREPACGGELEYESASIEGLPALQWVRRTCAELEAGGARIVTRTALVHLAEDGMIAHGAAPCSAQPRVLHLHPRRTLLASGAIERPIAFIDNDLPGVMLLGAAEGFAARYGVRIARRAVIFGNHDRLYAAARRLRTLGVGIAAIIDTRPAERRPPCEDLIAEGVQCLAGHGVIAALGRGPFGRAWSERAALGARVTAARIAPLASPAATSRIDCDAIFVSGGWTAMTRLSWPGIAPQAGGAPAGTPPIGGEVVGALTTHAPLTRTPAAIGVVAGTPLAGTPPPRACGAANGVFDLAAALADGHAAALEVIAVRGGSTESRDPTPTAVGDAPARAEPAWRMPCPRKHESRQFVDFQNDVTVADLRQACREGFRDIEHVKRYTTLGVGTDQGRTSGELGAAILAELLGDRPAAPRDSAKPRSFRPRPPLQPATLNSICGLKQGLRLRPERHTPLHAWHAANGGVMEASGLWMRPRFYRANGADATRAGQIEAARVRQEAGMVDASTLGKIEVAGPDAAAFLDRLYLTRASTLRVGRAKYMVMLREDGMVLDDGLVLRLAPDRFLATVSTGHAEHVLSHLEFWRDLEFAGRAVALADVTECGAVIAVSGPRSRERLQTVLGAEWSDPLRDLPHMQFIDGHWRELPLRVLRASFSGELAYELHASPALAPLLWQALHDAGVAPYGMEALDILRVEKGYLVSSEMSGQTTPQDLGLQALLNSGNDCIGRALLDRPAFAERSRPRLVGLRAVEPQAPFFAGSQLTRSDEQRGSLGYVTSAVYSPALNTWLGLALLSREIAEGSEVMARDPLHDRHTRVRLTPPVHLDPEGSRIRA